jgi:hypothetical protein
MRTSAVFVFTWKSASADDIVSATSNLDVLETCPNTLGHPKILEKDPMWFLLGTKTVPDGYDYEFEDCKLPVMLGLVFILETFDATGRDFGLLVANSLHRSFQRSCLLHRPCAPLHYYTTETSIAPKLYRTSRPGPLPTRGGWFP